MEFKKLESNERVPSSGQDTVYLRVDNWNDYSFVTMFDLYYRDKDGELHDFGKVKIGFKGQTESVLTHRMIHASFPSLDEQFFSLGQEVDFYKKMFNLPSDTGMMILHGLRDVVADQDIISAVANESVFGTSLLRYVSLSAIRGQFARVLIGRAEWTNFKFQFVRPSKDGFDEMKMTFAVEAMSTPSTNIHAVIGRNGVGKTKVLNGIVDWIVRKNDKCKIIDLSDWSGGVIGPDYFSRLVSVSFSAFDPFVPPAEQSDATKGTCYSYVGLKDLDDPNHPKSFTKLRSECVSALEECFSTRAKSSIWLKAIERLSSDEIFASMQLGDLHSSYQDASQFSPGVDPLPRNFSETALPFLERMSSGHAIVLLTISRLIATVEEKTLVIIDEPESHLHPPLLAAFLRALSELLHDRNGVAVIATHSPVVLQEIPRSCVWKIYRIGHSISISRPEIETFAENVGILTSEVFGLEVFLSGFHYLLTESVAKGMTYDEILGEYGDQIGGEGRAILAVLVVDRDRKLSNDSP